MCSLCGDLTFSHLALPLAENREAARHLPRYLHRKAKQVTSSGKRACTPIVATDSHPCEKASKLPEY
jgi:hypothetical protein